MPEALVGAYAEMRPRLEAEQLLGTFEATAAGSGQMKRSDFLKWHSELKRAAGLRRAKHRPKTAAEWKAVGMRVTQVEKKG